MIKINKTLPAPNILTTTGQERRNELETKYLTNPNIYSSTLTNNKNVESLKFDSDIYGASQVKVQLIADQNEKCCFCEAKFTDNSYGDVEHFRPKTAYTKNNEKTLTYPGYYWLAYEWTNLLFSCEKCNRSYKKNHFPLKTESTRKLYHNHSNILENEDTLLVNPLTEEPSHFITFNEEVPIAIDENDKGKKTIDIFRLERMNDSRLDHFNLLKSNIALAKVNTEDDEQLQLAMKLLNLSKNDVIELIDTAKQIYNSAAKPNAKFSYAVRCKFPELPTE